MRAPRCAISSSSVTFLPLISISRVIPSARALLLSLRLSRRTRPDSFLISPISSVYDIANQDLIYRTVLRPSQCNGSITPTILQNKNKIASVHIPVLIVSGALDTIALPWMPRLLYDRANQPKALHMLDGAEHNDLWDKGNSTLVGYIRNFVSGGSSGPPALRPPSSERNRAIPKRSIG